jgi:hypothetical protein
VVVGNRVHVEVGNLRSLGVRDHAAVDLVGEVLDLLEPAAGLDRVDELLEGELALTPHHEVGVLEPLLGQEARVGPADDRDAPGGPHLLREPVRLRRRRGDRRDRDEIGGEDLAHVDRVDVLDVNANVIPLRPHDGGEEHGA